MIDRLHLLVLFHLLLLLLFLHLLGKRLSLVFLLLLSALLLCHVLPVKDSAARNVIAVVGVRVVVGLSSSFHICFALLSLLYFNFN